MFWRCSQTDCGKKLLTILGMAKIVMRHPSRMMSQRCRSATETQTHEPGTRRALQATLAVVFLQSPFGVQRKSVATATNAINKGKRATGSTALSGDGLPSRLKYGAASRGTTHGINLRSLPVVVIEQDQIPFKRFRLRYPFFIRSAARRLGSLLLLGLHQPLDKCDDY